MANRPIEIDDKHDGLPIQSGDFPVLYIKLPEGIFPQNDWRNLTQLGVEFTSWIKSNYIPTNYIRSVYVYMYIYIYIHMYPHTLWLVLIPSPQQVSPPG